MDHSPTGLSVNTLKKQAATPHSLRERKREMDGYKYMSEEIKEIKVRRSP